MCHVDSKMYAAPTIAIECSRVAIQITPAREVVTLVNAPRFHKASRALSHVDLSSHVDIVANFNAILAPTASVMSARSASRSTVTADASRNG